LTYLSELVGYKLNRGTRPFQTVKTLLKGRNLLGHHRTETFEGFEDRGDDAQMHASTPIMDQFADPGFVARAIEDVERVGDGLLAAARQSDRYGDRVYARGTKAFDGGITGSTHKTYVGPPKA
jgi:hypothetical protein